MGSILKLRNTIVYLQNEILQITLVLASNYLGLKLGEMWNEVSKGLELQRIIPLRFDFKLMHPLANRLCEWSLHLRTLQLHLLQKEKLIVSDYE